MYDSIIIGSGPAGITAGLYMIRAGLRVLILSKHQSALDKAEQKENYFRIREFAEFCEFGHQNDRGGSNRSILYDRT